MNIGICCKKHIDFPLLSGTHYKYLISLNSFIRFLYPNCKLYIIIRFFDLANDNYALIISKKELFYI